MTDQIEYRYRLFVTLRDGSVRPWGTWTDPLDVWRMAAMASEHPAVASVEVAQQRIVYGEWEALDGPQG